ncbi:Syntaxin-71 [Citrus sinensis]|nr:Syntaxin-71 [Citrus sinensis]
METNRAAAVAMKAEVRRTKARLLEEVPKLQKLARKKVKGLSKEEQETRHDLVLGLSERIEAIPDGNTNATKANGGWATSASNKNIKFDSVDFIRILLYPHADTFTFGSMTFAQDQGLDVISEGLDTLKNLALDMNEELDRQVPLIDEIDTKVDKATSDLKNNNVRLKETLLKVRSSRNFCIDIILLCVILGIASYLYQNICAACVGHSYDSMLRSFWSYSVCKFFTSCGTRAFASIIFLNSLKIGECCILCGMNPESLMSWWRDGSLCSPKLMQVIQED